MHRAQGLLHAGSDTFDSQVLFPQIEDGDRLSRFAHLMFERIHKVQDTKSMNAGSLQIYQRMVL
jgi:hypothetical protein